jgi:hypothetical protein
MFSPVKYCKKPSKIRDVKQIKIQIKKYFKNLSSKSKNVAIAIIKIPYLK